MSESMDSCDGDNVVRTHLLPSRPGGYTMVDRNTVVIDEGLPSQLICTGYVGSLWKKILCLLFWVCTGGLGLLIFYWRPDWWLKCSHVLSNLSHADYVLLEDDSKQTFVCKIRHMDTRQALLMDKAYGRTEEKSEKESRHSSQDGDTLYFFHQELHFIWSADAVTFVELGGLDKRASFEQIYQDANRGLNEFEQTSRLSIFGPNLIRVEVPFWGKLLITEILNPFYVFQVFSCILWYLDEYEIYATTIIVSSIISALLSLYEVRSSRMSLHKMVEYHNKTTTQVLRIGGEGEEICEEIWSKDLVPGDVILIPSGGCQLACDAALVSGVCIVNESMLTGESVPVTKTPLPAGESSQSEIYSTQNHKRHTLFCGTKVIQTRYYSGERVKAVVVRTGFQTAKGQLVHSILYQKPLNMKLLRDAYLFVGVLCGISFVGFIYSAVIMVHNGEETKEVILRAFDIITIAIPPALPVAMTIGIVYAQRRLSAQNINCISSGRINISGQVDVAAFDKTGTLTVEGLEFYEALPTVKLDTNHNPSTTKNTFNKAISQGDICTYLEQTDHMLRGIASCHTLTRVDGKLQGDPMDMILFEATGWNIIEPEDGEESQFDKIQCTYVTPASNVMARCDVNSSPNELGIVRHFTFESQLQRASVIVHPNGAPKGEMVVYTKGSPEKVASFCLPHTIPEDFASSLKLYTQQGYRMIAMAYKPLKTNWRKAQKIARAAVEKDLIFLGLIALKNKLKPDSKAGIKELMEADIRTLMVTGDNLLTALSVAREVGMIHAQDDVILAETQLPQDHEDVTKPTLTFTYTNDIETASEKTNSNGSAPPTILKNGSLKDLEDGLRAKNWHLAVSGYDFTNIKTYFPEWLETLALKGVVFARMSPDQKTELVEELDDIGYHVCMCGDGANDCGALKRAHVGISLSEYEASVAAPFTSSLQNGIKCVPLVIREGRAALVTSFGMFKFMAMYSLIQFITITILYSNETLLSDIGFMYIDLLVIDVVALTMSRNYPCKKLDRRKPANSLISAEMLTSLGFNLLLQLAIQLVANFYILSRCWYNALPIGEVNATVFYEHSTCKPEYNVTFVDQRHVEDEYDAMEYSSGYLLLLSVFMYLSVSISFSQSHPFRTHIYKNKGYFISLIFLYAFNIFNIFWAPDSLLNWAQIRIIPEEASKYYIMIFGGIHFVCSLAFEMSVIEQPAVWNFFRRSVYSGSIPKFQQMLAALDGCSAKTGLQVCDPTDSINSVIESKVCMTDISVSIPSIERHGSEQNILQTNFSSDKMTS